VEIIDAQVHQPHAGKSIDGYGPEVDRLVSIELVREAMDCVGVDAALLNASEEFVDAAIMRYPERFAGCFWWNPETPNPHEWIRQYLAHPAHLAIRVKMVDWTTDALNHEFDSGRLEPLFAAAEKEGVPLFFSTHGLAGSLGPIAKAHPGLTVIVDHLGLSQPPVVKQRANPWDRLPAVLGLAEYPNTAVKFSGAPALSLMAYPHTDIWPHLHKIIDAFGPDRLMWGSDFTRLRMAEGNTTLNGPKSAWAGLYSDSVNYLRDTNEVSQAEKEKLFGGTIRRILRWPRR
jgi:predicted TIM-barrel fold metal-dependent hydrolase